MGFYVSTTILISRFADSHFLTLSLSPLLLSRFSASFSPSISDAITSSPLIPNMQLYIRGAWRTFNPKAEQNLGQPASSRDTGSIRNTRDKVEALPGNVADGRSRDSCHSSPKLVTTNMLATNGRLLPSRTQATRRPSSQKQRIKKLYPSIDTNPSTYDRKDPFAARASEE